MLSTVEEECSSSVAEALGRVIRYLREGGEMTQKELSERSGVHYVTISRVELATTGDVKAGTLERLARGLGTDPSKVWMAAGALLTGEQELGKALERCPVEDGMVHPGEGVMAGATVALRIGAGPWLVDLVMARRNRKVVSDLLQLVGRVGSVVSVKWLKQLVYWGLTSPDVSVRDAAVSIVAEWEGGSGGELIGLLREHKEPAKWLRDYIGQVVEEGG